MRVLSCRSRLSKEAAVLPYPYDHWKEKIRFADTLPEEDFSVIWCIYCEGRGRAVETVYRKPQPGSIDHPAEQEVALTHDAACPVCMGQVYIAVIPETPQTPWRPCATCQTYGRIFVSENLEYTTIGYAYNCVVSPEPCPDCKGLGFTVAATGETQRLL